MYVIELKKESNVLQSYHVMMKQNLFLVFFSLSAREQKEKEKSYYHRTKTLMTQ
jgi:hypothetical protein